MGRQRKKAPRKEGPSKKERRRKTEAEADAESFRLIEAVINATIADRARERQAESTQLPKVEPGVVIKNALCVKEWDYGKLLHNYGRSTTDSNNRLPDRAYAAYGFSHRPEIEDLYGKEPGRFATPRLLYPVPPVDTGASLSAEEGLEGVPSRAQRALVPDQMDVDYNRETGRVRIPIVFDPLLWRAMEGYSFSYSGWVVGGRMVGIRSLTVGDRDPNFGESRDRMRSPESVIGQVNVIMNSTFAPMIKIEEEIQRKLDQRARAEADRLAEEEHARQRAALTGHPVALPSGGSSLDALLGDASGQDRPTVLEKPEEDDLSNESDPLVSRTERVRLLQGASMDFDEDLAEFLRQEKERRGKKKNKSKQ